MSSYLPPPRHLSNSVKSTHSVFVAVVKEAACLWNSSNAFHWKPLLFCTHTCTLKPSCCRPALCQLCLGHYVWRVALDGVSCHPSPPAWFRRVLADASCWLRNLISISRAAGLMRNTASSIPTHQLEPHTIWKKSIKLAPPPPASISYYCIVDFLFLYSQLGTHIRKAVILRKGGHLIC